MREDRVSRRKALKLLGAGTVGTISSATAFSGVSTAAETDPVWTRSYHDMTTDEIYNGLQPSDYRRLEHSWQLRYYGQQTTFGQQLHKYRVVGTARSRFYDATTDDWTRAGVQQTPITSHGITVDIDDSDLTLFDTDDRRYLGGGPKPKSETGWDPNFPSALETLFASVITAYETEYAPIIIPAAEILYALTNTHGSPGSEENQGGISWDYDEKLVYNVGHFMEFYVQDNTNCQYDSFNLTVSSETGHASTSTGGMTLSWDIDVPVPKISSGLC
ncbi:hypothetical protein U3A55_07945 [Salarchaeum sp. III]|uniref:hypothetical protein n=1 Tax=Salarchaeum sp. III TaxID=3107927 RepID=UPI002EDB3988